MLQSLQESLDAAIVSAETLMTDVAPLTTRPPNVSEAQYRAAFKLLRHYRRTLTDVASVALEASNFVAEYGHTDIDLTSSLERASVIQAQLYDVSSEIAIAADVARRESQSTS